MYCVTNGQHYTTNEDGLIIETIIVDGAIKSLQFNWNGDSSTSESIDGNLTKTETGTFKFVGTATIISGASFIGNCVTEIDSSIETTSTYIINIIPAVGNIIHIGSREYVIANMDDSNVYVMLRYAEEQIQWNSDNTSLVYVNSLLDRSCETFYENDVPSSWKNAQAFNTVTLGYGPTGGDTNYCFAISLYEIFIGNNVWDYFKTSTNRIFTDSSSSPVAWWTGSPASSTDSTIIVVTTTGERSSLHVNSRAALRPFLAIKRSMFITE